MFILVNSIDISQMQARDLKVKSNAKSNGRSNSVLSNKIDNTNFNNNIAIKKVNQDIIEKDIRIKNKMNNCTHLERPKSHDSKKNTLSDCVIYINGILNNERNWGTEAKSFKTIKEKNYKEPIKSLNLKQEVIKENLIHSASLNTNNKEYLVETIINLDKENEKISECIKIHINLCKDLAGEIIVLRNEADKYKHFSTKN